MQLRSIVEVLDQIAPLSGAEAWDNVGLLCGDPDAAVIRVMMAIDATAAVLAEAQAAGAGLLVAYHPPLFKPVQRIVPPSPLWTAMQGKMALFSPHTALDAAHGGTNDVLADAAGLQARTPLVRGMSSMHQHKLVFFVPAAQAAAVLDAVFAAGAGHIGAYSRCSYQMSGEGSFHPNASAQPAFGRVGEQTRVQEQRVEVVVPKRVVGQVIAALLASHPYETPAFDLLPLAQVPAAQGQGRIGDLPEGLACDTQALAARLAHGMGAAHVMVACPQGMQTTAPVRRVAVQAGAGDSMLTEVVAQGAHVFVTGELRHHTVLAALAQGVSVITLTHDDSERAALKPFAEALKARAPQIEVQLSQADRSPWMP